MSEEKQSNETELTPEQLEEVAGGAINMFNPKELSVEIKKSGKIGDPTDLG